MFNFCPVGWGHNLNKFGNVHLMMLHMIITEGHISIILAKYGKNTER